MRIICVCLCLAFTIDVVVMAPSNFRFPDENRTGKRLVPVITPPVLPVLEHLERDPSTLLPQERRQSGKNPRHFGGGFNVGPSGNGGVTASFSGSASGPGVSQAASQSYSFGFNEGFSASHSASQSASFNGFGSNFSGSQASSQAASFAGSGTAASAAASSAASFGGSSFGGSNFGGSNFGSSQSASQAFGFNSLNGFQPHDATFGEDLLDVRHRGVPNFPFPNLVGRSGVGAAAFRSGKTGPKSARDIITLLVST